jgi:hypothetical protein
MSISNDSDIFENAPSTAGVAECRIKREDGHERFRHTVEPHYNEPYYNGRRL